MRPGKRKEPLLVCADRRGYCRYLYILEGARDDTKKSLRTLYRQQQGAQVPKKPHLPISVRQDKGAKPTTPPPTHHTNIYILACTQKSPVGLVRVARAIVIMVVIVPIVVVPAAALFPVHFPLALPRPALPFVRARVTLCRALAKRPRLLVDAAPWAGREVKGRSAKLSAKCLVYIRP